MDAHLVLELREQLRENRLLQEQQELKHQPMTRLRDFCLENISKDPLISQGSTNYYTLKLNEVASSKLSKTIDKSLTTDRVMLTRQHLITCLGIPKHVMLGLWRVLELELPPAHIREIYQNSFRQHASTCMRMLLNSMFKLGLAPENPENLLRAMNILTMSQDSTESIEATYIELWEDAIVRQVHAIMVANRVRLEAYPYVFENLRRISADDYLPSEEDLAFLQTTSTAVQEICLAVGENDFRFANISRIPPVKRPVGRATQVKHHKWISHVAGSLFFIYVASIHDAKSANKSLEEFKQLAQHPLLRKTPFMVIFFGEDKFREAAKRSELSGQGLFAELNSTDPETACSALTQAFTKAKGPNTEKHQHMFLNAIDSRIIKDIVRFTRDIVESRLEMEGLSVMN